MQRVHLYEFVWCIYICMCVCVQVSGTYVDKKCMAALSGLFNNTQEHNSKVIQSNELILPSAHTRSIAV